MQGRGATISPLFYEVYSDISAQCVDVALASDSGARLRSAKAKYFISQSCYFLVLKIGILCTPGALGMK